LEEKYGKQSEEVATARRVMEQNDTLLRAIWADPDRYKTVEDWVREYTSGQKLSDSKPPKTDKPSKGDEGQDESKVDPVTDLKTAEENRILKDFYDKYSNDRYRWPMVGVNESDLEKIKEKLEVRIYYHPDNPDYNEVVSLDEIKSIKILD